MAKYSVTNIFKCKFQQLKLHAKPIPPVPEAIWQRPLYFIAFGLGSGAMPIAPGTFGTLMAIPFYLLFQSLPLLLYVLFTLIFFIASAWVCGRVSRDIHIHDHPGMCIDEFAGFFVTMINAPKGFAWIVLGFLFFRLFDIWKPWPIRYLDEKIHGGIGMVLDDVVAGLYAMIILQFIRAVV